MGFEIKRRLHFRVLDLDLDFFLDKRKTGPFNPLGRLDKAEYKPWTEKAVTSFLEKQCGLDQTKKIAGKKFVHHDEVFYFLRSLQESNGFELKFAIDHVDAHGDLGFGDASYFYISSDILYREVNERPYPDKINGHEGLSKANFLYFAIACRWVSELNYINEPTWMTDIPYFIFRDFDIKSSVIELKKFPTGTMRKIISSGRMDEAAKKAKPDGTEPAIPFRSIDYKALQRKKRYDCIFLTQSPNYTPSSSDELIPIIQRYIDLSRL